MLTLELSDAGIMAAAESPPRLLSVDGDGFESPGFALPEKRRILLGQAAQRQAMRFPYKIENRFWDRLDNQPLPKRLPGAGSHAELAHRHLAQIWDHISPHGSGLLVAVPSDFDRHQMGLFLGMAQELGIPVAGFMPLAIAAPPSRLPDGTMVVIDVHLHRTEVSLVAQTGDGRLRHTATLALDDTGLIAVQQTLVSAIAETFVQGTRIDPLHRADSEQGLYDRLPEVLARLKRQSAASVTLPMDHTQHTATVTQDLLAGRTRPFMADAAGLMRSLIKDHGEASNGLVVLISARMAALPGVSALLEGFDDARLVEMPPGAGALNLLRCKDALAIDPAGPEAPYFSSRPRMASEPPPLPDASGIAGIRLPTHLLLDNIAYPIDASPLIVRSPSPSDEAADSLRIDRKPADGKRLMCTLRMEGQRLVLTPRPDSEIRVNGEHVVHPVSLALGDRLTALSVKGEIQVIACVKF